MKSLITLLFALGLSTGQQWDFKTRPSSENTLKVLGTSTVHDWKSDVEEFTVTGTINDDEITGLEVSVVTKSITSGKSIMDDKTYEALKAERFATIQFKAQSLKVVNGKVNGGGDLTIAGVTKPITLSATSVAQAEGFKISGSTAFKMSDFGINPPTAMFGSLKTADDVSIEFDMILSK